MSEDLETIEKANKAKGLSSWTKFANISDKLSSKHSKHITFSCSHPSHNGVYKHALGSAEGNLHFLLGYANPNFHLAPYHWKILYPDLWDEYLTSFSAKKGHPTDISFWEELPTPSEPEGDTEEGFPHPQAFLLTLRRIKGEDQRKVKSGFTNYTVDLQDGSVLSAHTGHSYNWLLVHNSLLVNTHKDLSTDLKAPQFKVALSKSTQGVWDDNVYPFVKSIFPAPGSSFSLSSFGRSMRCKVTSSSVDFFDYDGSPCHVGIYDRVYDKLLLTKGGIQPGVILVFAKEYLGLHEEALSKSHEEYHTDSPEYHKIPSEYVDNLKKSVVVVDGVFKLKVDYS